MVVLLERHQIMDNQQAHLMEHQLSKIVEVKLQLMVVDQHNMELTLLMELRDQIPLVLQLQAPKIEVETYRLQRLPNQLLKIPIQMRTEQLVITQLVSKLIKLASEIVLFFHINNNRLFVTTIKWCLNSNLLNRITEINYFLFILQVAHLAKVRLVKSDWEHT